MVRSIFSKKSKPQPGDMIAMYYDLYFERLTLFAYKIVQDEDAAKDITQNAFISYYRRMDEVASELNAVRSYLYATVKNLSYNYNKRVQIADRYLIQQEANPVEEDNAQSLMEQAEIVGEIYRVIAFLPEQCRRISMMAFIEGMSNQEIAKVTNLAVPTIKKHKENSRKKLKLALSKQTLSEQAEQAIVYVLVILYLKF